MKFNTIALIAVLSAVPLTLVSGASSGLRGGRDLSVSKEVLKQQLELIEAELAEMEEEEEEESEESEEEEEEEDDDGPPLLPVGDDDDSSSDEETVTKKKPAGRGRGVSANKKSHPVAKKSHPVAKKSHPVAKKVKFGAKKIKPFAKKNHPTTSRVSSEPEEESSPVVRKKPKSYAREPLVSKKKVAPRNPAKPPPLANIEAKIISEFTEEEPSFVEEVVEEEVISDDRKRKRKVEKENVIEITKNKIKEVPILPVAEASMEEMEPEIKIKRRRTLRRMDT